MPKNPTLTNPSNMAAKRLHETAKARGVSPRLAEALLATRGLELGALDAIPHAVLEQLIRELFLPNEGAKALARRFHEAAIERGVTPHVAQALLVARGLSAKSIETMPDAALRRAIRRLHYPDLPNARDAFRQLHLRVDRPAETRNQGAVSGHRIHALRHQESLRLRATTPMIAGIPVGPIAAPHVMSPIPIPAPGPGGIDPRKWTPLGPGNVGGRTRAIVPDADQPNRVWAASAGGGVWRSEDAGRSWVPVDDFLANLAVCCLIASPVRDAAGDRAMYAGTGEGFSNLDAIRGAGIFSSPDGGRWTQLPSANTNDFKAVNRLAISCDGKSMLAATPTGIHRSDAPALLAWLSVLDDGAGDVRFHPKNPALAVAGSLSSGEAYYSKDGGRNWTAAAHSDLWSGRVELTYASADPNIVYASVNVDGGTIYRSTDSGRTYTRMRTTCADGQPVYYLGDQGWYANAIWAGDPTFADNVIVGGLDLWRSTDGGDSLEQISLWYVDASVHADHHCIVSGNHAAPGERPSVFFGNDGGIFKTDDYTSVGADTDHTAGWSKLDNGYGVTQFYGAAGDAAKGVIVGGAQDNGNLRFDPGAGANAWTTMFGGDGGWCAYDAKSDVFYGEYIFCQINRSTDGGQSAEYICGQYYDPKRKDWFWKPPPYLIPDAKTQAALFIAPFVADLRNPGRLFAAGNSLWRTDDAFTPNDDKKLTGPSWRSVRDSIGDPISAIAISPVLSDVIWIGHKQGALFVTGNAQAQRPVWRRLGAGNSQPGRLSRYLSSIFIGEDNADRVYVTYAAYREGSPGSNVWASADGGANWSDIGGALPDAPVHKISRHATKHNFLFVGTEIALFASDDGGTNWSPTNEGPTNCPVYDLFWMGTHLICTTHGRGMFKIDIP